MLLLRVGICPSHTLHPLPLASLDKRIANLRGVSTCVTMQLSGARASGRALTPAAKGALPVFAPRSLRAPCSRAAGNWGRGAILGPRNADVVAKAAVADAATSLAVAAPAMADTMQSVSTGMNSVADLAALIIPGALRNRGHMCQARSGQGHSQASSVCTTSSFTSCLQAWWATHL